jgi:PAS domain S-box-containing protein
MAPFDVSDYIEDFVILVDQHGKAKWANRVFLQRKNTTLANIQGENAFMLMSNEQHAAFGMEQLYQALTNKQPATFTSVFNSIDQYPSAVNWLVTPCEEIENHVVITGRWSPESKQSQLQTSSQMLDAARYFNVLAENNSFFIVRIDTEGKYMYVNNFFATIMGYPTEEWIGRHSFETILEDDHEKCADVVKQCFANPGKPFAIALRKPGKNGIVYNQWEFIALTDEAGIPQEIFCIGYEITPLLERQQELMKLAQLTGEQNERLTQFTHIVSHNLRSHVSNLRGLIEITDLNDVQDLETNWGMLRQATESLEATLRNLNEVVSISTTGPGAFKQVNLMELMASVRKSLQPQLDHANAKIETHGNLNQWVLTVPAYLESILFNLLSNAVKYRDHSRALEIKIHFETTGNDRTISVSDNGIGIDLDRYGKKIFGMYKTFHGNKDARGVGLFITKTQVESMGGSITVASKPGEGSTFKITLHDPNLPYSSN